MSTTNRLTATGLSLFLGCSALVGVAADAIVATEVRAQALDTTYFYAALAPQGRWYYHYRLGWVWYPVGVEASWQPYTRGHWEASDEFGWVWASAEPFGWATDHYGRWYDDQNVGWVWVPGDVWGPAWVDWRISDTHVGWAPLPPGTFGHEVALTVDFGGGFYSNPLDFGLYTNFRIQEPTYNQFVFVDYNNFATRTSIDRVIIRDSGQRERLYRSGRNMTKYDVRDGYAHYSGDFRRDSVERHIGRQMRPMRIAESREPGRASASDDQISIYRPRIARAPKERLQRVAPDRLGLAAAPDEQPKVTEVKQRRQRGESKTAAEERKERGLKPLIADNPKELENEAVVGEQRQRRERQEKGGDAAGRKAGESPNGATDRNKREGGREGAADAQRERGGREAVDPANARDRQQRGGEAANADRKQRGGDAADVDHKQRGGEAADVDRKQRGGEAADEPGKRERDGKGPGMNRPGGTNEPAASPASAPDQRGPGMQRDRGNDASPGARKGERNEPADDAQRIRTQPGAAPAPAVEPLRPRGAAQQREQKHEVAPGNPRRDERAPTAEPVRGRREDMPPPGARPVRPNGAASEPMREKQQRPGKPAVPAGGPRPAAPDEQPVIE